MSAIGNHRYFVTGTDTGVGKTFVSAALLARAGNLGLTTAACKPVAAGADRTADGLRNEDALTLLDAIDLPMVYPVINPVCLEPAIAPHIAAEDAGIELSVDALLKAMAPFLAMPADFSVIEGAGGWRVPLNRRETLADLAISLELPVILVVSMRLGAINHALLTAEAVARDGLRLAGWVANQTHAEPMSRYQENLATLAALLPAPLLGEIAFQPDQDFWQAAEGLLLPDGLESLVGGG